MTIISKNKNNNIAMRNDIQKRLLLTKKLVRINERKAGPESL